MASVGACSLLPSGNCVLGEGEMSQHRCQAHGCDLYIHNLCARSVFGLEEGVFLCSLHAEPVAAVSSSSAAPRRGRAPAQGAFSSSAVRGATPSSAFRRSRVHDYPSGSDDDEDQDDEDQEDEDAFYYLSPEEKSCLSDRKFTIDATLNPKVEPDAVQQVLSNQLHKDLRFFRKQWTKDGLMSFHGEVNMNLAIKRICGPLLREYTSQLLDHPTMSDHEPASIQSTFFLYLRTVLLQHMHHVAVSEFYHVSNTPFYAACRLIDFTTFKAFSCAHHSAGTSDVDRNRDQEFVTRLHSALARTAGDYFTGTSGQWVTLDDDKLHLRGNGFGLAKYKRSYVGGTVPTPVAHMMCHGLLGFVLACRVTQDKQTDKEVVASLLQQLSSRTREATIFCDRGYSTPAILATILDQRFNVLATMRQGHWAHRFSNKNVKGIYVDPIGEETARFAKGTIAGHAVQGVAYTSGTSKGFALVATTNRTFFPHVRTWASMQIRATPSNNEGAFFVHTSDTELVKEAQMCLKGIPGFYSMTGEQGMPAWHAMRKFQITSTGAYIVLRKNRENMDQRVLDLVYKPAVPGSAAVVDAAVSTDDDDDHQHHHQDLKDDREGSEMDLDFSVGHGDDVEHAAGGEDDGAGLGNDDDDQGDEEADEDEEEEEPRKPKRKPKWSLSIASKHKKKTKVKKTNADLKANIKELRPRKLLPKVRGLAAMNKVQLESTLMQSQTADPGHAGVAPAPEDDLFDIEAFQGSLFEAMISKSWHLKRYGPREREIFQMGHDNEPLVIKRLAAHFDRSIPDYEMVGVSRHGLVTNIAVPALSTSVDGIVVVREVATGAFSRWVLEIKTLTSVASATASRLGAVQAEIEKTGHRSMRISPDDDMYFAAVDSHAYRAQCVHHCAVTELPVCLFVRADRNDIMFSVQVHYEEPALQAYRSAMNEIVEQHFPSIDVRRFETNPDGFLLRSSLPASFNYGPMRDYQGLREAMARHHQLHALVRRQHEPVQSWRYQRPFLIGMWNAVKPRIDKFSQSMNTTKQSNTSLHPIVTLAHRALKQAMYNVWRMKRVADTIKLFAAELDTDSVSPSFYARFQRASNRTGWPFRFFLGEASLHLDESLINYSQDARLPHRQAGSATASAAPPPAARYGTAAAVVSQYGLVAPPKENLRDFWDASAEMREFRMNPDASHRYTTLSEKSRVCIMCSVSPNVKMKAKLPQGFRTSSAKRRSRRGCLQCGVILCSQCQGHWHTVDNLHEFYVDVHKRGAAIPATRSHVLPPALLRSPKKHTPRKR